MRVQRGGHTLNSSDVVGALRRHWRLVAVWLVVAVAVAGVYTAIERNHTTSGGPVRYRSVANVSIPSLDPKANTKANAAVPGVLLRSPLAMALSNTTRQAAFRAAGLPNNPPGVSMGASSNAVGDTITTVVTSTDRDVAQRLGLQYPTKFIDARRQAVVDDIAAQRNAAITSIQQMRTRLAAVESDLHRKFGSTALPPVVPTNTSTSSSQHSNSTNNSNSSSQSGSNATAVAPGGTLLPLVGSDLDTSLELFERNALYNQIAETSAQYATDAVQSSAPNPYATLLGQTTAVVGTKTSSSKKLATALAIVLAGLVLGVASALLADRLDHTIRSPRAAAAAFAAPVLATIPGTARREEFVVLERPESRRTEAYRALAATSVATDRLPSAIMVTSPRGDAHEEVAANFAAALASLGVRVALVGTSAEQAWFEAPFVPPPDGLATFPQLLDEAYEGRLNGHLHRQVARTESTPNLVLVPPGEEAMSLRYDGLPPLLHALNEADVDVAVLAGPALFEDADATIVAWATRNVLWAARLGDLAEDDAKLGAARLELAGVNAFGVALLGDET